MWFDKIYLSPQFQNHFLILLINRISSVFQRLKLAKMVYFYVFAKITCIVITINAQIKSEIEMVLGTISTHNLHSGNRFGTTVDAHKTMMAIIWGPVIDIVIIIALYNYRKIWGYLHGLAGLFACVYTLATSIPILMTTGMINQSNRRTYPKKLYSHYLIGIVCLAVIGVQTSLGIGSRLTNILQARSMAVLRIRQVHAIFGYLIVALCKVEYLLMQYGKSPFWLYLGMEGLFILLLIIRKLWFPSIESKLMNGPQISQCPSIKSLKQLDQSIDYAVFANYVYDISPLKIYHPAGYEIVESVKNREIDRYIYGMYASESLPNVPIHSHSYKSFTLLEDPVAKINIPSVYNGFDTDEIEVSIADLKRTHPKGSIYQMELIKNQGEFQFQKYTSVEQLGRYYSINLNQKITRLYTNVNFLTRSNKQFLSRYLDSRLQSYGQCVTVKDNQKGLNCKQQGLTNRELLRIGDNYVPILFKGYDDGKFTSTLLNGDIRKLTLSCPKGEGLQFAQLKKGRILIIAGGAGLYPFTDLIDLLYKRCLAKENPQLTSIIQSLSPILQCNPFNGLSFHFITAFNSLQDIHPITYRQLIYLVDKHEINWTLKIKDQFFVKNQGLVNVTMASTPFENIIEKEMSLSNISKIWICGPPKMNENISLYINQSFKDPSLYLII